MIIFLSLCTFEFEDILRVPILLLDLLLDLSLGDLDLGVENPLEDDDILSYFSKGQKNKY